MPSFTRKGDGERPDHFKMVSQQLSCCGLTSLAASVKHMNSCSQFNARSESVQEKSIFSRLLAHRRCIVMVEGFFEWKQVSLPLALHSSVAKLHKHARATV